MFFRQNPSAPIIADTVIIFFPFKIIMLFRSGDDGNISAPTRRFEKTPLPHLHTPNDEMYLQGVLRTSKIPTNSANITPTIKRTAEGIFLQFALQGHVTSIFTWSAFTMFFSQGSPTSIRIYSGLLLCTSVISKRFIRQDGRMPYEPQALIFSY